MSRSLRPVGGVFATVLGTFALVAAVVVLPSTSASAATDTYSYVVGTTVANGQPGVGAGNIQTAGNVDVYTFTATAGQQLFLKLVNDSTGGNLKWGLSDPANGTVFGSDYAQNRDDIVLNTTGTYSLFVRAEGSATGTYGFRANLISRSSFSYTLGSTVSNGVPTAGAGNLEDAGYHDKYTFNGTAGQKLFLKAISDTTGGNVFWQLLDPGLSEVQAAFLDNTDDITLPVTGTYTLDLSTRASGATGTYSFRANTIQTDVFSYTMGSTISNGAPGAGAGNLEDAGYHDVYSFSGVAGQKLFFQALSDNTGGNATYRLLDPVSNVVSQAAIENGDDLTLPLTGTYRFDVSSGTTARTGSYSFRVVTIDHDTFSYNVGTTVSNGVPGAGAGNLEQLGSRDIYTFSGTAGQELFIKGIADSTAGDVRIELTDPVSNVLLSAAVADDHDGIVLPTTGTYTITLHAGVSAKTGTYSFRVNTVSESLFALGLGAPGVSNGVPAAGAGNLEDYGTRDVYAFTGTAGQDLYFTPRGDSMGGAVSWRLRFPDDGSVLFDTVMSDTTVVLPSTGTYQLTVYSGPLGTTGTYSFRAGPVGPPDAPTNVSAVAGTGQATVSWNPAFANGSPVTSYVVTPYLSGVAKPATTFNDAGTTHTVSGLGAGSYTFKVAATNGLGTGPASAPSNAVTTSGSLGAPTIGTALPGNGAAVVSWTAPASNGGSPITGYSVTPYIGAAVQPTVVFGSTATTQTLNGLVNGTTYTFKVQAINGNGTGPASGASGTVIVGSPTSPGFQAAIPGNASARVAYTTPSNNGSAITGYRITPYVGAAAQPVQQFSNTSTSQTVTGLVNGTTYTFKVQAVNARGAGAASTTEAIKVGTPASPAFPNPVPSGATGVRISWLAAVNNGSAVTGYRVTPYIGSTAQAPVVFNSTATLQTITGLTTGTTYTFKVAAVNAVGTGTSSTTAAVTVGTPAPPGYQKAAPGDGSATVLYAIPPNNGSAITGYRVTPMIGSSAQPTQLFNTPAASQLNVTGLTNGTTYTFRVQAVNGIGASPYATTQPIIVGAPSTPAFPRAQPGNATASVSFTASTPNGAALTNYKVTPYAGSTALATQTFPATATTVTVTGLTNGTTYSFQVVATNARGASPVGTTTSIKVGTPTAPGFPSALTGNASSKVSWLASTPNAGAITGYAVTPVLGTTVLPTQTFNSTATSQTVTGLTNGSSYTFRVAAINATGTGPYSTTAAVKIGLPAVPAGVTATAGPAKATVSWTAPAGNGSAITGYVITPIKAGVPQSPITYNSTATSQAVTGLTAGASYTFKVSAINGQGTGAASAASAPVVPT